MRQKNIKDVRYIVYAFNLMGKDPISIISSNV